MPRMLNLLLSGALAATAAAAWAAAPRDYQRATDGDGNHSLSASYLNFNRDPLALTFTLMQQVVADSMGEFGFSRADAQAMARDCGCTQEEYDRRLDEYFRGRALGWRTEDGQRRVYVDMPAVVERNRGRLRALARQFDALASARGYGSEEKLGAIITFVQSALPYQRPPKEEGGRDILGFYPPPRALEAGFGDCDTKSALLAAILTNFPGTRMIGIHVPKHYLVGIARVPRPGDAFIEYRGEPFVLIEPSGPGRLPPGTIAPTTQAALAAMADVRIDPLFD
ncbi:MAG: hypothetical protein ACT4PK_08855 [Gammaproteobacteria bacterium]